MSSTYFISFSIGALTGALVICAIVLAFWPLAEWEKQARSKWANGDVTLLSRIFWRLFRPVTISFIALAALGGAS